MHHTLIAAAHAAATHTSSASYTGVKIAGIVLLIIGAFGLFNAIFGSK